MRDELSELFRHLIDDRPGNFATKIVEAVGRMRLFDEVTAEAKVNGFVYTVKVSVGPRRVVVEARIGVPFGLEEPGPVIDWPGPPSEWTALQRFAFAKRVDAAFRGHADRFDAVLP